MRDLDERTVIDVGGWDGRFAVVRAVQTLGDRAAAVIDANGDGADINVEHYRWSGGEWHLISSAGGAGDWGRSWADGMRTEHDHDDEHGWWLTLEPGLASDDVPIRVTAEQSFGWRVYIARRRWSLRRRS